ncbi:nucleotidyltransferase family protein [soil metagenome]
MNPSWGPLLRALGEPAAMAGFSPSTWDLVVRQATHAGLLGRLGAMAQRAGLQQRIPVAAWRHLEAVLSIAEQQQRAVRWELVHLSASLAALEGPVLLLKGAAYAAANLPPGPGRLFADIDILVPKAQLDAAESALMLTGWVSDHHSDYDLRYYRQWMHELPPMTQLRRQTSLDLHHNILPESARIKTRPELILASAQPLREFPRFAVPAPADQILHSATHLFHEGEWEHGLRDLSDLDLLLREHGRNDGFWDALLARSRELGLGRPLFYALSLCRQVLATPIPAAVIADCPDRPGLLMHSWMNAIFLQALSSAHQPTSSRLAGPAAFALYLRSHYLRMPLHLLLPHLLAKAWQRYRDSRATPDEVPAAPH